jgi:hypothetical protein
MDWSEQIFAHQHDIKSLKLKCHPDKKGTGFVELNAYLEQISQYHNWEELIELAQSAQEIQDLYTGNYRYDPLKKANSIVGKKLTMQMIVDYIHQEFDTVERILSEFSQAFMTIGGWEFVSVKPCEFSSREFAGAHEHPMGCEFPRYESNKSFHSHMFTLEHLSKHLDMVVNDLQAIKSNMQKNYKFDQFYWYFDKSPKWKTALDIDFDWKSILNEKIQTKLLHQRCEITGLDPLSTQSNLVFYLLSPNFSSEMRFREKPRSLLEAYEFSQLQSLSCDALPLPELKTTKRKRLPTNITKPNKKIVSKQAVSEKIVEEKTEECDIFSLSKKNIKKLQKKYATLISSRGRLTTFVNVVFHVCFCEKLLTPNKWYPEEKLRKTIGIESHHFQHLYKQKKEICLPSSAICGIERTELKPPKWRIVNSKIAKSWCIYCKIKK